MKLNERVYDELSYEPYDPSHDDDENYEAGPSTPFEVQELEGHKVELFYMDDYKNILDEFTNKGKFAVWSSQDGVNYRLAVEKNYYEKLSELYSSKVNQVWLNFWDSCDQIQKNFTYKVVLPMTIGVIAIFLVLVNLNTWFGLNLPNGVIMGFTLGIPIVYIIFIMFLRKNVMNKINKAQSDSVDLIKKDMGEKKFEALLKGQRTYIDEFFKARDEAMDEEARLEDEEAELEEEKDLTNEPLDETKDEKSNEEEK